MFKVVNVLTLIMALEEIRNSVARSVTVFIFFSKSSPDSKSDTDVWNNRPCLAIKSLQVRKFSNRDDNSEMATFNSWLGTDKTFLSSSSSSISIARLQFPPPKKTKMVMINNKRIKTKFHIDSFNSTTSDRLNDHVIGDHKNSHYSSFEKLFYTFCNQFKKKKYTHKRKEKIITKRSGKISTID